MSTCGQVNTCEVIPLKGLFTVRQVSQCCGISRATILRLESKGLLTPAFVDPQTGYRYYDNFNVSLILQAKLFLEMGMSYDDILLYYRANGSSPELLNRVEAKYLAYKRAYKEIKLRMDRREEITFEFLTLPRYVCFAREYQGSTVQDRYQAMVDLYNEAVEKGYRLSHSEPLFGITKRTDYLEEKFVERECDFTCCIPLDPAYAPDEAVTIPSCRAYSCLFYGGYERRPEAFNLLGRKIRELGLKPTGYVRMLGLVAPYTGKSIPGENYVSRLVVPVEEAELPPRP